MITSGLIILLPLVAAFVGAIIGAYANSLYREREVKQAEDRERKGLLTLIATELNYNRYVLESIQWTVSGNLPEGVELTEDTVRRLYDAPRTEIGDRVLGRLAQLLPNPDLAKLAKHYGEVKQFKLWHMPAAEGAIFTTQRIRQDVEDLLAITDDASKVVEDSVDEEDTVGAVNTSTGNM